MTNCELSGVLSTIDTVLYIDIADIKHVLMII